MSLIKLFSIVCLFTGLLFFTSCEDNKKASDEKAKTELKEPEKSASKDTVQTDANSEEKNSAKKEYPRITNENVVEFLTEYGAENPETKVRISTQHGDIDIELYEDTPLHRANFIYLVKQQYFDGTFFHRVVPEFIIQAGNSDNPEVYKKRRALGKKYLLPAELENGRKHVYGTISGAKEYRENPDKKSAPFEFFIFLGKPIHTGHLNGNYTIFARVTKGMDVVEKIANLPADEGEWPIENVYVTATILQ